MSFWLVNSVQHHQQLSHNHNWQAPVYRIWLLFIWIWLTTATLVQCVQNVNNYGILLSLHSIWSRYFSSHTTNSLVIQSSCWREHLLYKSSFHSCRLLSYFKDEGDSSTIVNIDTLGWYSGRATWTVADPKCWDLGPRLINQLSSSRMIDFTSNIFCPVCFMRVL